MTSHSIHDFQAAMGSTGNDALAKLVKVWESNNTRRALRGSAFGLMAVSLAACGGSDSSDDEEPVDPPVEPPVEPPVTPVSLTLTAGADILDANDFTTAADTIAATGDTFQAGDIILDATSGDGDTLTVALTGNSAAATVGGIENIVFNITSFAAVTVDATNIANGTITVNNLQLGGITGADVNNAGNVTVVGGSGVTGTLDVSMKAGATTVVNSGAAATVVVDADDVGGTTTASQTITVVAAKDIDLTATDAAKLNISGSNVTVTLNAASADLTTIAGSGTGLKLIADEADVDGATVTGFASVTIDANGATDLRKVAGELIADNSVVGDTWTVASGATVRILDGGDDITLDVNDGAATNSTNGSVNVVLPAAGSSTIAVNGADDVIGTLNVSSAANQSLEVSSTTNVTVNLSGAGNFTVTEAGAGDKTINAAALTGALTAVATDDMLSITAGSGADTITAVTGLAFALVGGAGNDTLNLAADMTAGTFSGFEILTGTGDFLSSQLNGVTAVVKNGSVITIGADGIVNNTLNFSGLTFEDAANEGVDMTGATIDTDILAGSTALNITGSNGADTLAGGNGADVINGGAGADSVTGGSGSDNIAGGDGNDVLEGELGNDVISGGAGNDFLAGGAGADVMTGGAGLDNFVFDGTSSGITAATADTINDFVTADDEIDVVTGNSGQVLVVDGTSLADFAAFSAAANTFFDGAEADVYVAYNAAGTGNAWMAIDSDENGSFDDGDSLAIFVGVNTATELTDADVNFV